MGIVVAVAGLVVGGTIAFFNDTETSTGNVFTAGSIDLTVDHIRQTYNGVDCKTCSIQIVSDDTNEVVAKNGSPVTPYNAEELTFIHSAWTASVPGAEWIWEQDPVTQEDVTNNVNYTFRKTFTWFGPIAGATIDLAVASDNSYEVYLNGILVGSDPSENNFSSADTIVSIDDDIVQGTNTLEIIVTNKAVSGSTPRGNPAGLLYKLTINGNCGDDYFRNHCSLFGETDITDEKFFNFNDIKPGDLGTNVISLHVDSNDAYACLIIHDEDDQENILFENEEEAGDAPSQGNNSGFGELSNYIDIFAWEDLDGDGDYEPGDSENSLYEGSIQTEIIQMSLTGGGPTGFIGLAWCAGDIQVNHTNGNISCDGAGMLNDAQSDSLEASLTLYAEQQRNNSSFLCSEVSL